jgi:hypothetical protein
MKADLLAVSCQLLTSPLRALKQTTGSISQEIRSATRLPRSHRKKFKIVLCLAKTSYICKMNDLAQSCRAFLCKRHQKQHLEFLTAFLRTSRKLNPSRCFGCAYEFRAVLGLLQS